MITQYASDIRTHETVVLACWWQLNHLSLMQFEIPPPIAGQFNPLKKFFSGHCFLNNCGHTVYRFRKDPLHARFKSLDYTRVLGTQPHWLELHPPRTGRRVKLRLSEAEGKEIFFNRLNWAYQT
jgi:hypothetical protein